MPFSFEDAVGQAVNEPLKPAVVSKGFSFEEAVGGQLPPVSTEDTGAVTSPRLKTHSDVTRENAPARNDEQRRAVGSLAAVGDLVVDSLFMPLSVGANLGNTSVGLLAGQDRREALQKGREVGARFTPGIFNKILSLSPEFKKAYEESQVTGSMNTLNGVIEQIGINTEIKTKGKILQEDVQNAFDVGMLGMMGKGAAKASAPKPLYDRSMKIRVTDPKQLFKDDAAHEAFEADFKPEMQQVEAGKPRIRPKPAAEVAPAGRALTPDAEDLLKSVDEGGVPAFITNKLRKVASDHGIEISPADTPNDVVNKLRDVKGSWSPSDIAKAGALGAGAIGLSQLDEDELAGGAALAMATPAIRTKGVGSWHPEAVRRLAGPLMDKLTAGTTEALPERMAWAEDRVGKYLNRYAGTEGDPLKEVKLPNGETWEQLTDKVFSQAPAKEQGGWNNGGVTSQLYGAKPDEPVWNFHETPRGWGGENQYAGRELTSYLSHVGDFLRQNVDPKDLPRYDLVRAVKETAKNDERVAKEMDKATAAQTAQLPVYRDSFGTPDKPGGKYPNGMKWVELKLPKELTEEQHKSIKKITGDEVDAATGNYPGEAGAEAEAYKALDTSGKPIQNTYTNQEAFGKTPEEAHLAGQLAQEGNQMGHCVGGYCEGVASGESRIFSLRDGKGKSHVTVEVEPDEVWSLGKGRMTQVEANRFRSRYPDIKAKYDAAFEKSGEHSMHYGSDFWSWVKENEPRIYKSLEEENASRPLSISQIKGKQNRAPAPAYLPYVQDFVKGGKWGEVGDLEGTGLTKLGEDAKAIGLEPGYYTDVERQTAIWRQVPLENFSQHLAEKHPNVSLKLSETPSGAVMLEDIRLRSEEIIDPTSTWEKASAEERNKQRANRGYGQAALRDLTVYADANKRAIILNAIPQGDMPVGKLVEIYKRHDFEEGPYQPFPELGRRMFRRARGVEDAKIPEETTRGAPEVEGDVAPGPGEGPGGNGPGVVPRGQEGEGGGPGRGQAGSADPRLLAALAGAGIGGVLGSQLLEDNPIRGFLLGAMAAGILPYVGKVAKTLGDVADPALGMLSTRIKNISEPIHRRALDFEREVLRETTRYIAAGAPLLRALKDAPADLKRAIVSNDQAAIKEALLKSQNPDLINGWMQARAALREIGEKLVDIDRIPTVLDGYFPRVVKDVEGLLKALDHESRTDLEKKLANAERAKAAEGGLSEIERSKIINQFLSGRMRESKPGFAKGRTIRQVTDDLMPFYAEPAEAYTHYINASVNDLAKQKFFGRDIAKTKGAVDVDKSIGNVVDGELDAGRINHKQLEELRNLLGARLGPDRRFIPEGGTRAIHDLQNITYMGLLGNIVGAATQLGDSAMSVYAQGLAPTVAAMARRLTGNAKIRAEDLGVVNHISDEFASQASSAKWLNNVFKVSGFSLIDRFGKDAMVGAADSKFRGWAKSTEGQKKLAKDWGAAFGDEFPALVDDLRSGKRTDLTDSLLFAELSRYQPISRLEAPEIYNRIPDLRPAYMLKRWMLKQADVVRRDAYDEMKKGNYVKGAHNLVALGLTLGISGATTQLIQDYLQNKPLDDEHWFPIMDQALKTFGWSQYTEDKMKKEGVGSAIASVAAPPYQMWDRIIRMDPMALQYVPWIGRLLYGKLYEEEIAAKAEKAKAKREREASK